MHYPINEIFQTIQGEGYHSGKPSIFIRLQGCPVRCTWCDTKYTWTCSDKNKITQKDLIQKKISNQKWSHINSKNILLFIKEKKWTAKHIVITGGEPCVYNLLNLTEELEKKEYTCQIETSGTQLITCSLKTWVTLSPKKNKHALYTSVLRSNEIKYPILKEEDLLYLEEILLIIKNSKKHQNSLESIRISLQPISQNKKALDLCIKTCIKNNWYLSVQLQKYLLIQ